MIFVFRHPSTIVLSYSRLPVNNWCANNVVEDISENELWDFPIH